MVMMAIGLALMGLTYGPLGTVLSELFPTPVRYTGSSLTFNFAGIFGASLAPYIATWLAKTYGLQYVGYYLSAAAALTMIGLLLARARRRTTPSDSHASSIFRTYFVGRTPLSGNFPLGQLTAMRWQGRV